MNLTELTPETSALQLLSSGQAKKYRVVPMQIRNTQLFCIGDKINDETYEELAILTGKEIEIHLISSDELDILLAKSYRNANQNKIENRKFEGDASLFVKELIIEAKNYKSSDIHIEVYENDCRVRIRIDGKLIEKYILEKSDYPVIINRIKILSNLDISEKRLPQDGRIFFNEQGVKFDIRVSVLPTLYGEKCVMRILSNDASAVNLDDLGLNDRELGDFKEAIKKPFGLMLVSGPTGSGKTTTLYATLKELNKSTTNILTIEDPIEYTLKGVNQVQLRNDIGLDFANALRTFLRQDPDVIMVGEIRDPETANMALRASLTGHLVLSTIHTNTAWGIVSRLIDMGIPSYLIAGTVNTLVAQRLVRKLCTHCKKEVPFENENLPKTYQAPFKAVKPHVAVGCEICHFTGYSGRKAIYEVIAIDSELAHLIRENKQQIKEILTERNIKTLDENAFDIYSEGTTSLEEIYPILMNAK